MNEGLRTAGRTVTLIVTAPIWVPTLAVLMGFSLVGDLVGEL